VITFSDALSLSHRQLVALRVISRRRTSVVFGAKRTCTARSEQAAIKDRVRATARAVAIALDAQVAETDVVRAPHRLNANERGVVGRLLRTITSSNWRAVLALLLCRRRLLSASATAFRRGHWRRFPSHKTWIKWTLVDDPDLGFIDKRYRL
jgi:hypothetical protein